MGNDSTNTKRQKAHLKEAIEVGFRINLPEWFIDGATVRSLRSFRRIIEDAHNRYMESGRIPTVGPSYTDYPSCSGHAPATEENK